MAILDVEPSEHESQAAFFEWWEWYAPTKGIAVELCFAVPNGGHRHPGVAGKLKAEGVRAGVCDVFLLVPRGGFHALILEFKRKKPKPSADQEKFMFEARGQGYNALIVRSTDEAIHIVTAYLAAK